MNEVERLAERVKAGEDISCMSTGEQIAAAFLFNRMDWLPEEYSQPLEAFDRLGPRWTNMMLEYQRKNR